MHMFVDGCIYMNEKEQIWLPNVKYLWLAEDFIDMYIMYRYMYVQFQKLLA